MGRIKTDSERPKEYLVRSREPIGIISSKYQLQRFNHD